MHLVLSTFTSSPTYLLANIKTSVFSFIILRFLTLLLLLLLLLLEHFKRVMRDLAIHNNISNCI